ncbi:MAG: beta-galactosidase [Janthinobacterium lividum]
MSPWNRVLLLAVVSLSVTANGQTTRIEIDAAAAPSSVEPVKAMLGTARNPAGRVLGVNSQYLTLDGKPWLPVMGELHYSRVPASEWEHSILQMKAAGVQIISSYVIWIHHEQTEGEFVWTGDKDLRHFAELCAKHQMYFFPRLGPWAHGEVRNGGLPDWVMTRGHIRQNDPNYLAEVKPFYQQIARQLNGLYWKDGGPVIGVQIENEYREQEEGKGSDHIRTLTNMAKDDGIDVPFYTVTGWDGAAIPLDTVLPVFGGYPDAPWGDSNTPVTGADVYSFRFGNRAAGNMGAIGGQGQNPAGAYQGTPFLTAEVGAGMQETYYRRITLNADDVAAIAPVILGSGANLLGYYMFRGGRNPDGGSITLQESQRTGYPTDVPTRSYDFQAPLSANGEERESLRRLKLVHYFLNDFGNQLAPMMPHAPDRQPSSAGDLSVPRVAARNNGDAAFLFLNNYIRNGTMPDRPDFNIALHLPHETVTVPRKPIVLPSGAYGIWPVNLDLSGVRLRYSTAQLFKHQMSKGEDFFFFFAIPGIKAEFLLERSASLGPVEGLRSERSPDGLLLEAEAGDSSFVLQHNGRRTHVILLSQQEAEDVWTLTPNEGLLLTSSQFFTEGETAHLRNDGDTNFRFGLFGAGLASDTEKRTGQKGPFTMYSGTVPPVALSVHVEPLHAALTRPAWQNGPPVSWRKHPITLAPAEADYAAAASWKITVEGSTHASDATDTLLQIHYDGDVARLQQGGRLLDDDFWNGLQWCVGTNGVKANLQEPMSLSILPLPRPFSMYFENEAQLPANSPVLRLRSVEAIPQYQLTVTLKTSR